MSDWRLVIYPLSGQSRGGTLHIFAGEEQDAIEMLELYADIINANGFIPDSLDFRSLSPAVVGTRMGKRTFRIRADCFEHETEHGVSSGHGYMTVVEDPE